jgi:hypothetical protein
MRSMHEGLEMNLIGQILLSIGVGSVGLLLTVSLWLGCTFLIAGIWGKL